MAESFRRTGRCEGMRCARDSNLGYSNTKQKEQRTRFAALRLVPSPGTLPNRPELLVERVESKDARFVVGANAQWIDANDSIFFRAESTNTGLVDVHRLSLDRVSNRKTVGHCARASVEGVTALAAARRVAVVGQHGVNQARGRRLRRAAYVQRSTEVLQPSGSDRVSNCRIGGLVRNFSGSEHTDRRNSGRLVSRNTRTQQVRNRDSSDDQNDRHYDQQLDQ